MLFNFIYLLFFIYATYQGVRLLYDNRTRFKYLTNSYVDYYQTCEETEGKSKSDKRIMYGLIVATNFLLVTFMIDIWLYDSTNITYTVLTIIQILGMVRGLRQTYGIYFIEEEKENYHNILASRFRYIFAMILQFISLIYCMFTCVILFLQLIK